MAEWSKAVDLRPTIVKMRGFEPLSVQKREACIRCIRCIYQKQTKARMAERSKAVDLRPTIVMMRGFESLSVQKRETSFLFDVLNVITI